MKTHRFILADPQPAAPPAAPPASPLFAPDLPVGRVMADPLPIANVPPADDGPAAIPDAAPARNIAEGFNQSGRWHRFGILLLTFLIAILLFDIYRFLDETFQYSSLLGVLFVALLGGLGYSLLQAVQSLRREWSRLGSIEELRCRAETLLANRDSYSQERETDALLHDLAIYYADQPGMSERLNNLRQNHSMSPRAHLEMVSLELLESMDERALRATLRHARQSAILFAISRLPLVDSLIALWKGLVLVREIATIYGNKPGALASLKLFSLNLSNLVFADVTDLLANKAAEIAGGGLLSKVSMQMAQGLGMGMLIGRIGLNAMLAVRPLPFLGHEPHAPNATRLLTQVVQVLGPKNTVDDREESKPRSS